MLPKIIWTVLLVLFTLGEAISVGLTSIWFAAGSLAALICALLEGPWPLQIALFIAVSTLTLLRVMARHGVKQFVFSSPATVYGDPATVPIRPLSCAPMGLK